MWYWVRCCKGRERFVGMPGQGGGFSLNGGDVKVSLRLKLNLSQADQQNRRKNRKKKPVL